MVCGCVRDGQFFPVGRVEAYLKSMMPEEGIRECKEALADKRNTNMCNAMLHGENAEEFLDAGLQKEVGQALAQLLKFMPVEGDLASLLAEILVSSVAD